jgi:hypothetical protein
VGGPPRGPAAQARAAAGAAIAQAEAPAEFPSKDLEREHRAGHARKIKALRAEVAALQEEEPPLHWRVEHVEPMVRSTPYDERRKRRADELRGEGWSEQGIEHVLNFEAQPHHPFDPPKPLTMRVKDIAPAVRARVAGEFADDPDARITFAYKRAEPLPDDDVDEFTVGAREE